jgi:putative ABC transport system permease protein
MIKNYIKIAWRNLMRNKVYSFINIAGLSIGLMVSILILLFVVHEVNYDKFHVNGDKIFKVGMQAKHGDQIINVDGVAAGLAPKTKEKNPSVLDYVRIKNIRDVVLKNSQNPEFKFKEKSFVFADKSLFTVFTYTLKQGDIKTALENPFSLIISEKAAKKYFGNDNPIGKTLVCDAKHTYNITGIMNNVPSNSSMTFDFVTSLETYPKLGPDEKDVWEHAGAFRTYLLLNDESKLSELQKNITDLDKKEGSTYALTQYSSQHLSGGFRNNTNARFVYIFSGIALMILFLALFNYMSLTTARATTRAKEVGIRKVVGVSRLGLIQQFYIESILVCSLAFGLAFILIQLLLQPFYNLLGIQIDTSFLSNPTTLAVIGGLFLFSAFIAGSYPALMLSKFIPIEVLKGKFTSGQGGSRIRKGITVFQFMVSVGLIICVIVTQKQLNYLKTKDLGFSQSQVLAVPTEGSMNKNFLSFKNDIRQLAGVQSITSATTPFYKGYNAWFTNSNKSKKEVMLFSMTADENFFKTVGLQWANAPISMGNLDKKVFINESAAKQLELEKDLFGQFVSLGKNQTEVGGILKDFHFTGLREQIQPLAIRVYPESLIDFEKEGRNPTLYVRFEANSDITANVATVKKFYDTYKAESPFEYYFLDEAFNETFAAETRLSTIFSVFTAFAIFIACMGLFGLIAFAAETRTKEIGIRKVLGASVGQIVVLLSKDFIKLIIVAFAIAAPLAGYVMNKWLQDFAFHINISWWIFALAGCLTVLIALLTVSFQAVKAAVANPVKSLRTE